MKAAWYDDLALGPNYSDLRAALELSIGEVLATSHERDFVKSLDDDDAELYVFDFQLEDRHGVDIAREVLAKKGDVPILFLSEYLDRYPDFRQRLDPRARIETVFKPLSDPFVWAQTDLAEALRNLRAQKGMWLPTPEVDPPRVWELSVREFEDLGFDTQLDLILDGAEQLEAFTEAIFDASEVEWVVIVGPEPTVTLSGNLTADPPAQHVLKSIQTKFNCVPIVVFRSARVEMVGESARKWTVCTNSDDRDLRRDDAYPALSMLINGHEGSYHLDTGSSWSFLGYEDSTDNGIFDMDPKSLAWYKMNLVALGENTPVLFCSPKLESSAASTDGGWVSVTFKPRVIRRWRRTPLARLCPFGRCESSELVQGRGKWCGSRRGLVGRDLLRHNAILLILDSIRRQTFVADDPSALLPLEESSLSEWELSD